MTRKKLASLFAGSPHYDVKPAVLDDILERINKNEVRVSHFHRALVLVIRTAIVDVKYRWKSGFTSRLIQVSRIKHGKAEACHRFDGIGRKLRFDQEPISAARACMDEKLNMRRVRVVHTRGPVTELVFRPKFGFIPIIMEKHYFECFIPKRKFKPSGFTVTSQNGKAVYIYGWLPQLSRVSCEKIVTRSSIHHD